MAFGLGTLAAIAGPPLIKHFLGARDQKNQQKKLDRKQAFEHLQNSLSPRSGAVSAAGQTQPGLMTSAVSDPLVQGQIKKMIEELFEGKGGGLGGLLGKIGGDFLGQGGGKKVLGIDKIGL